MPYSPGILGQGVGMPMHPAMAGLDPMGMGMMGPPGLHPMGIGMGMGGGIGMGGYYPGMLGGMRSRHTPYYHQSYAYGPGRGGARYLDSYDLFDDVFDEDVYMNDYDDIDDPLLMWMRMARGGGGGRRGRRSRYGRYGGYGGGGLGYHGLL
jgi:hypothetical protein